MTTQFVTLQEIKEAGARLQGIVHHTPLEKSETFSRLSGQEVYLKLENLQKTGAFKIRGAFNKIATLSPAEKEKGVIAASAGNHAQGVALAAAAANIPSTVVMPEGAPLAKVEATSRYGAKVVLFGQNYDEAFAHASYLQGVSGATFVHAFNDPAVIAGQGTVGLEILADLPDVGAIIVPVGGGGLISGVAAAAKSVNPKIRMVGVQASGAASMVESRKKGMPVQIEQVSTIADGIAVKKPGDLTFAHMERFVDDLVTVEEEDIAGSILMLLERAKVVVEGAGAVGLAALLSGKITPPAGKVVVLLSGGNIDFNTVSRIIERGLVKNGRSIRLSVLLADRPGALQRFLARVAEARGNVISIWHNRYKEDVPLGQAEVEIRLETRDHRHAQDLIASLRQDGYDVKLL